MARVSINSPLSPHDARVIFARTLQNWATDILALRRAGLDRPSHRRGHWKNVDAIAADRIGPWPFAERPARAA